MQTKWPKRQMVLALTELIRQETKAQGGKITSPGLAQQ